MALWHRIQMSCNGVFSKNLELGTLKNPLLTAPTKKIVHEYPVKNLSSHLIHCQLTLKLTASSFWGHLFSSQWTHKMSSHCELAMSFPWVCNSHSELSATTAWRAHRVISRIAHSKLVVWVENSQKAHNKFTVWAHLLSSLWVWANQVSSKWAQVSFLWVWY